MPEVAGALVRPLTTEDVMTMVEAGIIGEDERIELEEGVIVLMSPIDPPHRGAVRWLNAHFTPVSVGRDWEVSVQDQIDCPGGFRRPDLLVTHRLRRDEGAETGLLIVEVADSSARRDREKALLYAQLDVDEYWIADLNAGLVLVHQKPGPDGYADVREAGRGEVRCPGESLGGAGDRRRRAARLTVRHSRSGSFAPERGCCYFDRTHMGSKRP